MLVQVLVVVAAVGGGVLFSIRKKIRNLFSKDKTASTPKKITTPKIEDDAVDVLDDETK
jgi:hypothetical protein